MNITIKPKGNYTSSLPPTPCTPEMNQAIRELAADSNASIAEIQRAAFTLFLRENARIADSFETEPEGGDAGE